MGTLLLWVHVHVYDYKPLHSCQYLFVCVYVCLRRLLWAFESTHCLPGDHSVNRDGKRLNFTSYSMYTLYFRGFLATPLVLGKYLISNLLIKFLYGFPISDAPQCLLCPFLGNFCSGPLVLKCVCVCVCVQQKHMIIYTCHNFVIEYHYRYLQWSPVHMH